MMELKVSMFLRNSVNHLPGICCDARDHNAEE